MGSSIVPAASVTTPSDNWVQIAATNPAATSLNFTSISGYKKLMTFWDNGSTSASLTSYRFNSDSGTKYQRSGWGWDTAVTVKSAYTTSAADNGNNNQHRLIVTSADNTNMKEFTEYVGGATVSKFFLVNGIYQATAAITSINLVWGATFSQTVYLYGVAA